MCGVEMQRLSVFVGMSDFRNSGFSKIRPLRADITASDLSWRQRIDLRVAFLKSISSSPERPNCSTLTSEIRRIYISIYLNSNQRSIDAVWAENTQSESPSLNPLSSPSYAAMQNSLDTNSKHWNMQEILPTSARECKRFSSNPHLRPFWKSPRSFFSKQTERGTEKGPRENIPPCANFKHMHAITEISNERQTDHNQVMIHSWNFWKVCEDHHWKTPQAI